VDQTAGWDLLRYALVRSDVNWWNDLATCDSDSRHYAHAMHASHRYQDYVSVCLRLLGHWCAFLTSFADWNDPLMELERTGIFCLSAAAYCVKCSTFRDVILGMWRSSNPNPSVVGFRHFFCKSEIRWIYRLIQIRIQFLFWKAHVHHLSRSAISYSKVNKYTLNTIYLMSV